MKDRIKGALLGTIAGDALGSPLEGMSSGHILSSFKKIDAYIDPSPALKGKMERWKMPGLYSSISQIMILLSLHLCQAGRFLKTEFSEFLRDIPDISGNEPGIIRHPDRAERSFLDALDGDSTGSGAAVISYPCARPASYLFPIALLGRGSGDSPGILSCCSMFNTNVHTLAGACVFSNLLKKIIEGGFPHTENLPAFANQAAGRLQDDIKNHSDKISDLGVDAEKLAVIIEEFRMIFSDISSCGQPEEAEEIICSRVNMHLKTPVKRASVNHPLAVIPYAVFISSYSPAPREILFTSAREGGSAAVLCSLAGGLAGALHGAGSLPEELLDRLVNKRRITAIIENISGQSINRQAINDFILSEASLTRKEAEERSAGLKHQKIKPKKKKPRGKKESELTKHVVESWTKMDQARWRKRLEKQERGE